MISSIEKKGISLNANVQVLEIVIQRILTKYKSNINLKGRLNFNT